MVLSVSLAFLAGMLSILSPCVLPLLPIVFETAASQGKYGPVALAAGVVLAFVAVGLFVALIGFSIGLDGGFFKSLAAVVLFAIGLALISPALQNRISAIVEPISRWGNNRMNGFSAAGASGQFGLGLLLGTVWSPCVGPTLGAASLLAAQGKDLGHVIATMTAFAVGVGVPLLAIGMLSRSLLQRSRTGFLSAGRGLKLVLGLLLVLLAAGIFTGYDKTFEAVLVDASPAWLTNLTTHF